MRDLRWFTVCSPPRPILPMTQCDTLSSAESRGQAVWRGHASVVLQSRCQPFSFWDVCHPFPGGHTCSLLRALFRFQIEPVRGKARVGVGLAQPDQQPVAAHRRMPVEAAVKRGGQLPRRTDIPIRGHHVADLVRVLLMHTGQREIGEALPRLGIEGRRCGVATTPRGRRDRTDRADSISSPPTWARW